MFECVINVSDGRDATRIDRSGEAAGTLLLDAHRAARRCFEWFLGRNDLGQPLYDSSTGGCHDALHPDRVNQNQGAESTLAFQLALAEMIRAEAALVREAKR